MATGTLPFAVRRYEVPLILFLVMYVDLLNCQQFIVPFKAPSDCGVEEFFDISSLSCVRCGPNQRRSTTGLLQAHNMPRTDLMALLCQQKVALVLP